MEDKMNGVHTVETEDHIQSSFFDWLMRNHKLLQIGKAKKRIREKTIPTAKEE